MAKLATLLFALLLLGCEKEQKNEQAEPPNILDCAVSCDYEKIKAWYQKKYGESITDFELLAKEIFVGDIIRRDFNSRDGGGIVLRI